MIYGDSIYAKFVASNIYGVSPESNSGNGATVVVVPDPPINLVKNVLSSS